jgi:hypothetical protein
MKLTNFRFLAWLAPLLFALGACDQDYMTYDVADQGVYFTRDTLTYSFSVTPIEVKSYSFKVPFRVMGATDAADRPVAFSVVASMTNAVEGVQYTIGDAVLPADSIDGYIPIEILRDGLEGNYTDGYTKYTLVLRLETNDYFRPMLDSAAQWRTVTFDNAIEQPNWLNAYGDKVWSKAELGVWHPYKFIKMVEYFHAIADILPETYEKMVAAYGENLESIPYGDVYLYRTIFKKYVYLPMYEFFNDPANREMILANYPDFPFDFPNPY